MYSKPGRAPYIFTRRVQFQIKQWVADDVSREEIAARLGTSVGSLAVTCSRLGIPLTNRQKREPRNFVLHLTVYAQEGLRQYASDLGWTEEKLLSELVEVMHKDKLFAAVLDRER